MAGVGTQRRSRLRRKQIFDDILRSSLYKGVKLTERQKSTAIRWAEMIRAGRLVNESDNYDDFRNLIMIDILGYKKGEIKTTAAKSGRHPDFIVTTNGKMDLCVEAKGTEQGLFERQHRNDAAYETPILQATLYKGQGYKNAFCTNYRDFVLIGESDRYHVFDFLDVYNGNDFNDDKLREFIKVFSRDSLIARDIHTTLITQSMKSQKKITVEFYSLFDETRKMLINTISMNAKMKQAEAAMYSQMILNRLTFIFFATDKKLAGNSNIFRDSVVKLLTDGPTTSSKGVWEFINNILFIYFRDGNQSHDITEFNGGLFMDRIPDNVRFMDIDRDFFNSLKPEDLKLYRDKNTKFWKHDQEISDMLKNTPNINPIIINLLKMDNYDFNDKLGPNLLGHIFEKSMSMLEKIGSGGDLSRKKTGAYYTLENVTSHICRNTIFPYLSRGGGGRMPPMQRHFFTSMPRMEQSTYLRKNWPISGF